MSFAFSSSFVCPRLKNRRSWFFVRTNSKLFRTAAARTRARSAGVNNVRLPQKPDGGLRPSTVDNRDTLSVTGPIALEGLGTDEKREDNDGGSFSFPRHGLFARQNVRSSGVKIGPVGVAHGCWRSSRRRH